MLANYDCWSVTFALDRDEQLGVGPPEQVGIGAARNAALRTKGSRAALAPGAHARRR
jgi:hypothetical protein